MLSDIIGFDSIEHNLWSNFQKNKLHHCNLITGTKGIGKFSFAQKFSNRIISFSDQTNNIRNHPDLLIINSEFSEKEKKGKILVDDIRKIYQFINLSNSRSKHKIIIIDAIDEMNINASNNLLKIIEEPNNNIFIFLINHNIGNVLDTIKSRSNLIKVKNFSFDQWSSILERNIDISKQELENLYIIEPYSINNAIILHQNNWLEIYKDLIDLFFSKFAANKVLEFVENNSSEEGFTIFKQITLFVLYRLSQFYGDVNVNSICESENIFFLHKNSHDLDNVFLAKEEILQLLQKTKIYNLEKKYILINILNIFKRI